MKRAIFPGSFDPWHSGHANILNKALLLFDEIYIVVSKNWDKENQNPIAERAQVIALQYQDNPRVVVITNEQKFTYQIADELQAKFIIRGLRNNQDLRYEVELSFTNKQFSPQLETIYFIADHGLTEISSTMQRQIAAIEKQQVKK